jgi:undecaprenyl-diphosphatase
MVEGDTLAFDRSLLMSLREPGDLATPIGPAWLREALFDITALGGTTVLTMISVLAIAFLLLFGRYRHAAFTALATGGGALLGTLLKSMFARARPEVVPHLIEVHSLSFPSGHALNSAIVFLTLAVLLAREFKFWRLRIFVVGIAATLVLLIGFSRLYLGVHFPSDVLAGWSVGAAWALAMGILANVLHRIRVSPPR